MTTTQATSDAIIPDAMSLRKARSKKAPRDPGSPNTTATRSGTKPLSKAEQVLKKLGAAKGVTIQQMMEATNWQAHSVRGFLSGVVRKKLGHELTSEVGKDGVRRYRITASATTAV